MMTTGAAGKPSRFLFPQQFGVYATDSRLRDELASRRQAHVTVFTFRAPERTLLSIHSEKHIHGGDRAMIIAVGMNPALDRILMVKNLEIGATLKADSVKLVPSGKGANIAAVMHLLGEDVIHTGFLGIDEVNLYKNHLNGIECDFFEIDGKTRTDTTIIDPVNGTETHIREPGFTVTPQQVDEFLSNLFSRIHEGDLVTLSGSLPPGAPPDTYAHIIHSCKNIGAEVFLDTSGEALHEGAKAAPTLMKPNDEELEELTGRTLTSHADIISAAHDLLNTSVEAVAVSLGARGAVLVDQNENWRGRAVAPEVVNTVGCGDAFACGWLWARRQSLPLGVQLREALAVGGANAMTNGAGIIDPAHIDLMRQRAETAPIHTT